MISKNKIKYIRSLELKKNRNKEGKFVAEGFKVVDDLLALQPADLIVATQEWLHGKHLADQTEVIEVTEEELKKVSFLQHPQQVLAVFDQRDNRDFASANIDFNCLNLALDGVQDPGNLGTIWRTADAAGFQALLLGAGGADPLSPKVQRAAMGSGFRVPFCHAPELAESLIALRQRGYRVFASDLSGADFYARPDAGEKFVLVIGNEARGISDAVREAADCRVKLPMRGGAESLNAAVAAGIMMYELMRGR